MVLRPNALKSSHFSHSKCYKNRIYEGNYLKLGTYILWSLFYYIYSGFLKILKFGGFLKK